MALGMMNDSTLAQKNNNSINDEESLLRTRADDGEFEDTRGLQNQQILGKQKSMITIQDQQLEEIHAIVQNIKYENENFGNEVTFQNKMLDQMSNDIDKT